MKLGHLAEQVAAEETESPNIAPLIDIVFILLIFFVVTTTFTKDLGLEIERPEASTATDTPSRVVRVAISSRGELTVDARPTSPWRLEDEVKERLTHYRDKTVLLVADKGVPAGKLVTIMDHCRRAGARDVAVAVEAGP
jgi:biopolymer transport protein ExbD